MAHAINCKYCGRFISYADMQNDRAKFHEERRIADIYGGISEEWYWGCATCEKTEREDGTESPA